MRADLLLPVRCIASLRPVRRQSQVTAFYSPLSRLATPLRLPDFGKRLAGEFVRNAICRTVLFGTNGLDEILDIHIALFISREIEEVPGTRPTRHGRHCGRIFLLPIGGSHLVIENALVGHDLFNGLDAGGLETLLLKPATARLVLRSHTSAIGFLERLGLFNLLRLLVFLEFLADSLNG